FGEAGYFAGVELELREEMNWLVLEAWYAKDVYAMAFFDKGKFIYVRTGASGSISLSADCDKF
ncbi:hypothetical protein OAC48_07425, partial [Porticoccaceae bacterium]|nr:hypothetical protein [Porticoccaceae bacterium]